MTFPANPTATSAVVGDRLRLVSGPGIAALLKGLTMPAIIAAFATYLLVGIITMKVPANAVFPGPQFFPGIIAAGLYLFAAAPGRLGDPRDPEDGRHPPRRGRRRRRRGR
ncbi:MAG: hypothetical protein PGN24_04290 [Microbacterium arborescens]